ncbi:MAG: S8 family serine peptidase [Granulosicoccus sp.]
MTEKYHARYTGLKTVPMSGELPSLYDDFLSRMESRYGLKRVANWPLPAINIFCVVFEVRESDNRANTIVALAQEPDIETAQLVQTFDSQSEAYNDPYLPLQHGFHDIDAFNSHQWTRGKGIRVAVIDTGMDDTHPDLAASSEATRNFVDSDVATFRADTHGTAIGGIIAAEANNGAGMVGIAPDAALLGLKACWHTSPDESRARCNTLTLAKALNYSIEQEVDIINLSLTGPPDPVLERLVLKALSNDIVVIGAIPTHNEKAFPVSIPGTIAVAMPGKHLQELSAPGHRVLSTSPNDQYDFYDGSSFSTAHVTGLVALVRSLSPTLTPVELSALLVNTANPQTGAANACRALDVVMYAEDESRNGSRCVPVKNPPN